MTCKSFCCENKVEVQNHITKFLYVEFIYVFAMAGQTAESNVLNFSEETHGYLWG